jgi:nucleoside-diphosphate-sugar epimerase
MIAPSIGDQLMKSILVTGVTGFIGSSMAARFLKEGNSVVALSRNDKNGIRTRQAVIDAANGFDESLSQEALARLKVVNIDFSKIDALASNQDVVAADEAWHSAAEMTYNPKKLDSAIQQNLNVTYRLHRFLDQRTSCKRFYYISTAYTAGMDNFFAEEKLHLSPSLINVYQTSKWSAEMSLSHAAIQGNLPVTIFRPSIVVGHSKTGWHGASVFGFYSFIRGMLYAKSLGTKRLQLDLDPAAQPNLIPIDILCAYSTALAKRENCSEKFEIFHAVAANNGFTVEKIFEVIESVLGIELSFSKPENFLDRIIGEKVKLNAPFAKGSWTFDMRRLQSAIGKDCPAFIMQMSVLSVLLNEFAKSDLNKNNFATLDSKEKIMQAALRFRARLSVGLREVAKTSKSIPQVS